MTANLPTQRQLMTSSMPAAFQNAAMDPAFAKSTVDPKDISAGIGASFGVVSIRGKVFRIKFRGEEYPVVIPGTNHPAPTVEVVMIKASQAISKIWYEGAFQEGSRDAPDCFSTNGVQPDLSSPKKQSQFCATCPQNQWGSKTLNGKALKACQDTKRVAVVPLNDLKNESFGGPMLIRVPPASLQDLSTYADQMVQWGQTYYSVGTQLSFDIEPAHPKLNFAPIAPLTGEQAEFVVQLQDHPQVKRMLTEAVEYAKAESAEQPAQPPGGVPINRPQPAPPAGVVASPQAYAPPAVAPATGGVIPRDDLAIPTHLKRPQPAVVPAAAPPPAPSQEYQYTPDGVFRWKPGMAAWEPVPPAAPALPVATLAPTPPGGNGQALTAEQQEIAALKAQLAEAQKPAPRSRKKATPPPSPAPTAVEAAPAAPPPPAGFSVAAPGTPAGQPATAAEPAGGAAPADLNTQLSDKLTALLPKE